MAKFDKVKIAKAFIRGNVNFWGGKNIPLVQSVMNFALDPKKILDQYRVDPRTTNTTSRLIDEISRLQQDAMVEEEKLEKMRKAYAKLVTNLISLDMIIGSIDPNAFLPRPIYNLTTSIINTNRLNQRLMPHVFYAVNTNTHVDQAILRKYAEGIVKLRQFDQQLRTQNSRVQQKYNLVLQKIRMAHNEINNRNRNR